MRVMKELQNENRFRRLEKMKSFREVEKLSFRDREKKRLRAREKKTKFISIMITTEDYNTSNTNKFT